jgi:two-component system OmpR family sensor kinase
MNASLRRRLFLWLSASIVVMSAATTALSFALSYDDANDLQDAQLQQVAAVLATQPQVAAPAPFHPRSGEEAETHFVVRALGVSVPDPDPRIDVPLPETLSPGLQSISAGDVHWRVMVGRNAGGQAFGVAQRQTVRDEVARDSALLTLVPMLVLVPLLLLIVHFLLRQGFARLVALSGEVDQVDAGRLAALDPHDVPLEALPLVHAVNRLVRRLGAALDQQRRMVADAAHELRTPVAATRVQADNLVHAVAQAELPPEARTRLDALQRGLGRLSELIEQLLRLARVQGAAPAPDQPIALDEVVRAAIEETLPLAEARGVDLGCVRLDPARLRGDASNAYALVRNVIDNAVRYTPAGGSVDVGVEVLDGVAVLLVEDTGPGISPDQRERVFEPFFRILGTQQVGSGLGLAIVRSAAQALGGAAELSGRPDGRPGLRFTYRQDIA